MSEETDLLETRLSEEAGRMALWKSFMEHPGWGEFKQILETLMKLRQEVVCSTPINTEYSSFAQEFFKGEFTGIKTALSVPQAQYDEAQREVVMANQRLENEHEIEKRIAGSTKSRVDTDEHFG